MKSLVTFSALARSLLLLGLCLLPRVAVSLPIDSWLLKDNTGVEYSLEALRGKWVLINFWAPWCPSCVTEIPELSQLQQRHKDVQVIGVAVAYKNQTEVLKATAKHAAAYPIVLGNDESADDFGGLVVLPTSFLFSPTGQLIGRHQGPLTRKEIELAMKPKKKGVKNLFVRSTVVSSKRESPP